MQQTGRTKQLMSNSGFALNLLNLDERAEFHQRLTWQHKTLAALKPGQVQVKILASVVNPSDLVFLMGKYGIKPIDGQFAGFEGVGIVQKANAGLYGRYLLGKRVACFATPGEDGLWAQFANTSANFCVPVHEKINNEQAATLVVNPLTAILMIDRAKQLGAKTIVLNAAASQVGKCVIAYAKTQGIQTIATVRHQHHIAELSALGATRVINIKQNDYFSALNHACRALNASVALDSVASNDTAILQKAMPDKAHIIVYGRLEQTHDKFGGHYSVSDIIFREQQIEGFWLAKAIKQLSAWQVLKLHRKVQKLFISGLFKTDIYQSVSPEQFIPALTHYAEHKSDGKVILTP